MCGYNTLLSKYKRIFRFTLCILLSVILCSSILCTQVLAEDSPKTIDTTNWPAYPDIYAECGVLLNAETGEIIYDKNCHKQMYPASITKILTTLCCLELSNPEDMVTYYHYDMYTLEVGDAHIGRQEGEQLSMLDSLYAVMLASANECAYAVAEYIGRGTEEYSNKIQELKNSGIEITGELESTTAIAVFADIMNERAKQAGATDSHFINPNGLFNEDHYTTCYDMAMITKDAIANDQFLEIESNLTWQIPATAMQPETQYIANRHKMLYPDNSNYYEGVFGGKTGYVFQSGNTLVTFAKQGDVTLIAVVMNSNASNVYNDTKLLFDYGFKNFSLSKIDTSFMDMSKDSQTPSITGSNFGLFSIDTNKSVILPNNVSFSDCSYKVNILDESPDDDIVGKVTFFYGNNQVGSTDLLLTNTKDSNYTFQKTSISKSSPGFISEDFIHINLTFWIIISIILIIIIFILLFIFLNFSKKRGLLSESSDLSDKTDVSDVKEEIIKKDIKSNENIDESFNDKSLDKDVKNMINDILNYSNNEDTNPSESQEIQESINDNNNNN